MASESLTATGSSGSQTNTQSPQTAGAGNFTPGAQQSGSVQPGTATDVLTSQNGTPLANTSLTTVSLGSSTGSTTAAPTPTTKPHHINPGLLAIAIFLFVFAVALFWSAARPEKNTTV
jgi:hypothetical protein